MSRRNRLRPPTGFPIWRLTGLGALAVVGASLLVWYWPTGGAVDAEARYDGVHLCSPEQQTEATATAQEATGGPDATGSPVASPGAEGTPDGERPPSRVGEGEGPFFKQNSPTWGEDEYDNGTRQNVGCGVNMAQCGCATTSVATVMALFNLVTTGDGEELNPRTLNDWFNEQARMTNGGWVSRGYQYGSVAWLATNTFSAEVASQRAGSPIVSYRDWGQGTPEEIRSELRAGRPVVLEVPGHFIAAVGLDGEPRESLEDILINDPFYADRVTLAAYDGLVKSSRLFNVDKAEDVDLSAISVTVPNNVRVRVSAGGRTTGTLDEGKASEIDDGATEEIPGSVYRYEEAWRDPTCTERAPKPDTGTNTVIITRPSEVIPEGEVITIEVVNPDGGETTVGIRSINEDGEMELETIDSPGDKTIELEFDPEFGGWTGGAVTEGGTPTATATGPSPTPGSPTPSPGAGTPLATPEVPADTPLPGEPTRTPGPEEPTDTPRPTDTPAAPITPSIFIGSATVPVGGQASVDINASLGPPGIGSWDITIQFNPEVLSISSCEGLSACNEEFRPDAVRLAGASPGGPNRLLLASLAFRCESAGTSTLIVVVNDFTDNEIGNPTSVNNPIVTSGNITCL